MHKYKSSGKHLQSNEIPDANIASLDSQLIIARRQFKKFRSNKDVKLGAADGMIWVET